MMPVLSVGYVLYLSVLVLNPFTLCLYTKLASPTLTQ